MNKNQILRWSFFSRLFFGAITPFYIYYSIAFHIKGSDFFTGQMPTLTGEFNFKTYAVEFSIALAILSILYMLYKSRKKENLDRTIVYFFIYTTAIAYYYIFLSLSPIEIVHFFQYFILVFILGKALDPHKEFYRFGLILYIASIVGTVDEIVQYYILSPGHYHIDFNDIYLNSLSTIGGCLIYYGFKNPPELKLKPFYKTVRFYISSAITLIILIAMMERIILHSPVKEILPGYTITKSGITFYIERKAGKLGSWQPHAVKGKFYNLSVIEGIATILLVTAVFASFDKRTFLFIKDPFRKYFYKHRRG